MKSLKEAVDRAAQGEGSLVFLHGEAGIGKTRLIRELGAYARMRRMQVLNGRCPTLFRMDGVPPYVLWSEVIRDYLDNSSLEQLYRVIGFYPAEVAKLVPELAQKLKAIPQSFPISSEQEQNRLFEAVTQFITNISREAPLLVVLDDLQWADPSSLLLLHYMVRGVQRTPLLLVGAYRSTDIDAKHPLTPVLTELNREHLLQSFSLKRMSPSDVSEMIKNILEQDNVPDEFCNLVYEKTKGNPFFAEEVIKSLKEEDVIYREENGWKIKEVSEIEFPETVKSIIRARMDRLDEESQNVLTLSSFVGNDFSFEALHEVTGIGENKLLELMEKMLKTGLVKERLVRGKEVYYFADVIMRDVLHKEVSLLRHKKLHDIVACALEKLYAKNMDEHLGELAYHFLESGDNKKALDYFLNAGEKAANIHANVEAFSYFQSALNMLEEKEGEAQERACVIERMGDIKNIVGEYEASIKYWNDALILWKELSEKHKVSRLHLKMAHVLWSKVGNIAHAREHQAEVLRILEKEPESVELATLYEDIACMVSMTATGNMAEALSWAEKALELARKLGAQEAIARSYMWVGEISDWLGDRIKAATYVEKALKIALENGYTETALIAYNDIATYQPREQNEKRLGYYEKGYELAKKVGDTFQQSWLGLDLAYVYGFRGDMSRAICFVEESVAFDRKAGNTTHLCMSLSYLGFLCSITGEWDKAELCLRESLEKSEKVDDFQSKADSHTYYGWLHFNQGEFVKAKEFFEKAAQVYDRHGAMASLMGSTQNVIWACIELGEIETAKDLLDKMRKFAAEKKEKLFIANADALEAMLCRVKKKWKESIEFFEKSIQGFEALDAKHWNVYFFAKTVLHEYARLYMERDQEGDKEKARDLLNQALEIFQKMGAKKDIEKVEAKLLYIETGKVASVPKPTELVCTRYANLDKLLCGGLSSSSAVVLTSPSCNERDSLIRSFLETGAKKGEVTFYVTIDPGLAKNLANEFQSDFYLFVCNPQADTIVKEAPNIFKLKGVENLTDIGIALTSAIRKLDPMLKELRRICIGLVSDVLLQHHAVQTRRWLTGLISELRSNGFTTLAIMDPEMHSPQEVRAVLDLFDGEINIYEKGAEQFLKIKRMSNQEYLEDELLLTREHMKKQG